eukprot:PhM_4_TR13695/c0_g1_i1/m.22948/K03426/E3.6.1.22, NUDT12, nudC; NAD+ diphosphatase
MQRRAFMPAPVGVSRWVRPSGISDLGSFNLESLFSSTASSTTCVVVFIDKMEMVLSVAPAAERDSPAAPHDRPLPTTFLRVSEALDLFSSSSEGSISAVVNNAVYAGRYGNIDVAGVMLSSIDKSSVPDAPPKDRRLGLRAALASWDPDVSALHGYALGLLRWRARARFCGSCGAPTRPIDAGTRVKCDACNDIVYPRTDVVATTLVRSSDNKAVLLARGARFPPRTFSALAGFVEMCESLEAAAAREVKEEIGVDVTNLRFCATQPWPLGRGAFPELMVAFHGTCSRDVVLTLDPEEIAEARWFSRDEIVHMMAMGREEMRTAPFLLPPVGSQSFAVISDFVEETRELEGTTTRSKV